LWCRNAADGLTIKEASERIGLDGADTLIRASFARIKAIPRTEAVSIAIRAHLINP